MEERDTLSSNGQMFKSSHGIGREAGKILYRIGRLQAPVN